MHYRNKWEKNIIAVTDMNRVSIVLYLAHYLALLMI